MTLRVVTVTTLLICAFAIELLLRPADTLRPLFTLAAVAYGMVLLYAVLDRWLKGTRTVRRRPADRRRAGRHLLRGDHRWASTARCRFSTCCPSRSRRCCSTAAAGWRWPVVCWSLYAALCVHSVSALVAPGIDDSRQHRRASRASGVYLLVAHLVACWPALLSSYLSERLRAQGESSPSAAVRWPG